MSQAIDTLRENVRDGVYLPVNSKKEFVPRYKAGEFGNMGETWDSVSEWFKAAGFSTKWDHKKFHIRNRVKGGATWYNILGREMLATEHNIVNVTKAARREDLYITAMAPHEKNLLQGEIMESPEGLYVYASDVTHAPMREALKYAKHYYGLSAVSILKANLCTRSMDWVYTLLERYPGHVIEFSCFSCKWGTLPNFNTAFWEVRNY